MGLIKANKMTKTLEQQIYDFLQQDHETELEVPFTPVEDIEAILEEQDYLVRDSEEQNQNGWEVTFWYKYDNTSLKKTVMYTGSLYYGDTKLVKVNNS